KNRMHCFSVRVDVNRPIKFTSDHVAEISSVNARIAVIPAERAKSTSIPIRVVPAVPSSCVTGLGIVVPNCDPPILGLLIGPFGEHNAGKEQPAANKNQSNDHH